MAAPKNTRFYPRGFSSKITVQIVNKLDYNTLTHDDFAQLSRMGGSAYTTRQGMQHILLIADDVLRRGIKGSFVECGVAAGAMAGAMAWALKKARLGRVLHLFDSFDGIPLAGPNDEDQPGIGAFKHDVNLPLDQRLVSSGVSRHSLEQVKANMLNWDLGDVAVNYVRGWFQHTLPLTQISEIALLHLDGDLYESTRCCLEYLYPKTVKGGVAVLDDYPRTGSRRALEEYFATHGLKPDIRVEVDTGAAHWEVE